MNKAKFVALTRGSSSWDGTISYGNVVSFTAAEAESTRRLGDGAYIFYPTGVQNGATSIMSFKKTVSAANQPSIITLTPYGIERPRAIIATGSDDDIRQSRPIIINDQNDSDTLKMIEGLHGPPDSALKLWKSVNDSWDYAGFENVETMSAGVHPRLFYNSALGKWQFISRHSNYEVGEIQSTGSTISGFGAIDNFIIGGSATKKMYCYVYPTPVNGRYHLCIATLQETVPIGYYNWCYAWTPVGASAFDAYYDIADTLIYTESIDGPMTIDNIATNFAFREIAVAKQGYKPAMAVSPQGNIHIIVGDNTDGYQYYYGSGGSFSNVALTGIANLNDADGLGEDRPHFGAFLKMHAVSDTDVIVWCLRNPSTYTKIWEVRTTDQGATWNTPVDILPTVDDDLFNMDYIPLDDVPTGVNFLGIACDAVSGTPDAARKLYAFPMIKGSAVRPNITFAPSTGDPTTWSPHRYYRYGDGFTNDLSANELDLTTVGTPTDTGSEIDFVVANSAGYDVDTTDLLTLENYSIAMVVKKDATQTTTTRFFPCVFSGTTHTNYFAMFYAKDATFNFAPTFVWTSTPALNVYGHTNVGHDYRVVIFNVSKGIWSAYVDNVHQDLIPQTGSRATMLSNNSDIASLNKLTIGYRQTTSTTYTDGSLKEWGIFPLFTVDQVHQYGKYCEDTYGLTMTNPYS